MQRVPSALAPRIHVFLGEGARHAALETERGVGRRSLGEAGPAGVWGRGRHVPLALSLALPLTHTPALEARRAGKKEKKGAGGERERAISARVPRVLSLFPALAYTRGGGGEREQEREKVAEGRGPAAARERELLHRATRAR